MGGPGGRELLGEGHGRDCGDYLCWGRPGREVRGWRVAVLVRGLDAYEDTAATTTTVATEMMTAAAVATPAESGLTGRGTTRSAAGRRGGTEEAMRLVPFD